jgi:nitrogenase molybdenum-cofactor synthesis protein NifE
MAKQMEKRFNIPYIQVSLYSLEEISNCLHDITAKLNKPELTERIEKVIAEQNTNLNTQLGFYRPKFKNKRIIIEITSNTWSIISVAKKLNLNIIPIVSSKISQEEQARIQSLLNQDVIIIEQINQNQVLQLIQDSQADMLVARASYQNTAIQAQIPFLDVNTLHVYTGYTKIISAVQKLYAAFQSPIWQQLHKSAPWQ